MRRHFFALALGVIACATPDASADLPTITYAERVAACVTAADGDASALNACKGVASQPCMEADGGSTYGLMSCLSEEGGAWQSLMVAAEARLAAARPETAEALTSAQEHWRAYREAECSYAVARWGEGSGARVELAGCMANMVADRAIALIVIERLGD